MAEDLAHTPVSGLRVQACGDAHLLNFGVFATPEGTGDTFDRSIGRFAAAHADQNERDHAALLSAVRSGRVQAAPVP